MNRNCCGCDPRACAVALGRWMLGIIFLFAGIGKLPNIAGFVNHLLEEFQKTWLPKWLLVPYGYVLPFIEVGLGVLLLLGIARSAVLFAAGLLCISLTFGQLVLMQPQVMFYNFGYTFAVVALLALSEHDRIVLPLGNRPKTSLPPPVP